MTEELFEIELRDVAIELVYDADESVMSAEEVGQAIQGMATILRFAGKASNLDFDDVYFFPAQQGSIKIPFKYGKGDTKIILLAAGGNVVSWFVIGVFQFIGTHGLSAINTKRADLFSGIDPKIVSACLNNDFKKSVDDVARPLSERNKKLTIKLGEQGYVIECENQEKFLNTADVEILPELEDGKEVTLEGVITRINRVPNNDVGFEYKGRKLSLQPLNPDETVSQYHGFLETPYVTVHGIVSRISMFENPKILVIDMKVTENPAQLAMFEEEEVHSQQ